MKRQRGRGRKPGNSPNRSYESNGPEVKIRGNASQIYDKYMQLARDASSAGDRVRAENLFQHAEHYLRIVQLNQPRRDPSQDDDNGEMDDDEDGMPSHGNYNGNGNGYDRQERSERQDRSDRQERTERPERQDRGDRQDRQDRGDRQPRERRDRDRDQGEAREPRRNRNNRSRNDRSNERDGDRDPQDDPLGVVTPQGDAPSEQTTSDMPNDAGHEAEEPRRRTRRPRRTKAEMEAARAAEAALKSASNKADGGGSDKTGGDGPESEAA